MCDWNAPGSFFQFRLHPFALVKYLVSTRMLNIRRVWKINGFFYCNYMTFKKKGMCNCKHEKLWKESSYVMQKLNGIAITSNKDHIFEKKMDEGI